MTAQDPTERVRQLVALTERLTALMAAQANAFETHRPQDAARLIEECGQLSNVYRHESARVRENPALLDGTPPDLRRRLLQATEAFDAVLARQARALNAAKTITEGLVHAIAQEVASQRSAGAGYGPGAQAQQGDARAITLNRSA
jgi:hypothetical protein